MKFRVSGKDLGMFLVFGIFLLYLCAILTSNVSSFGTTGTFSGLNPIPGLTKYLGATVVLFIILIVLIFTSVSSYVFERKKGLGFEVSEKDEKGYSRWSKDSEIKNDKDVVMVNPLDQETKAAGIPLVNDGKHLWVDNGEYHNLVIGSTGSGKSQTVVEPMVELLIKKGESMIITDPKGELHRAAAEYLKQRGYNVVVLNFREPQRGNAWNPLTLPYQYYKDGNFDKATELLDDVAINILYDPNNKSGDPFWEKSAADYFSGLALGLFEDAKPEEINLNSINYMSTIGEDKMGANTYIKEYFTLKGEQSNAYVFASNTINAPADTKGGILSVFRQKIRIFASRENLSEMLAYSDFDMRDIGKEKTAVFIVIHDEKTTYHGLATIFIKQCYETLIDVAQQNGGKLPFRTIFILDEFENMPPLKDVTTMVTAARSRAIRFTFIIQNFAQLKSVYGNEDAETIKGNCGNLVYLISTELAALEEISKMCGDKKSSEKDKTASTPLVSVTDLQKLKLFQAIIIRWRLSPYKVKYTPNFKMDWGHPKVEADYPHREKKEIQLFNVKEFTKKKKGEKIKNSLNDGGKPGMDGSPFGGGNPFAGNDFMGGGFNPSNPFMTPPRESNDSGLFGGGGGLGGGIDLDAMMKDIDRKIAELDAEEERQKREQQKLKDEKVNVDLDLPKIEDKKDKFDSDMADLRKEMSDMKSDFKDNLKDVKNDFKEDLTDVKSDIKDIKTDFNNKVDDIKLEANNKVDDVKENINDIKTSKPRVGGISLLDERFNNYADIIEQPKAKDVDFEQVVKKPILEEKPNITVNNYNIYNDSDSVKETNISKDRPNIAIATSSPADDDFDYVNPLPKVESATIVKPNYSNGTVSKVDESREFNIYDKVPNMVDAVKDEVKSDVQEIKHEVKNNVQNTQREIKRTVTSVGKPVNNNKTEEFNVFNKPVEKISYSTGSVNNEKTTEPVKMPTKQVEEKTNVNVDPNKIVIGKNTITDDEFFDDFFGDD